MAPLSKPEDDKWRAESVLVVAHPSCLPGSRPRGAAMSEETPHVATRKEEATNMESLIPSAKLQDPAARLLPLLYLSTQSPLTSLLWGSPAFIKKHSRDKLFSWVFFQFSICSLCKEKKAAFTECWLWGSQSDTCSHWTATTALESGHYYSLLTERLYLLLKDTQISHNSIGAITCVCAAG